MNFIKLKNKFLIGDYQKVGTKNEYGMNTPIGFVGIKYSYIDLQNSNDLLKIIPEEYQKDCTLSVMDLNYQIPPHTDSDIEAIVNFYIKTDNCVTQFYKIKNEDYSTSQVTNQTDGFIFDPKDLIETDSFIAEDGDAYLLNVSQPHSVITTKTSFVNRKAICLQIKYRSFEEAKQMLITTNQI